MDELTPEEIEQMGIIDDAPLFETKQIGREFFPDWYIEKKKIKMTIMTNLDKFKQIRGEKLGLGRFGCPPEGDGKTVSGEPDKRCKDGSDDVGGKKSPKKKKSLTGLDNLDLNNTSTEYGIQGKKHSEKINIGGAEVVGQIKEMIKNPGANVSPSFEGGFQIGPVDKWENRIGLNYDHKKLIDNGYDEVRGIVKKATVLDDGLGGVPVPAKKTTVGFINEKTGDYISASKRGSKELFDNLEGWAQTNPTKSQRRSKLLDDLLN